MTPSPQPWSRLTGAARRAAPGAADPVPGAAADLAAGLTPVDALVKAGLAKSRGEARRLVEQGGVYLNNRKAALDSKITPAELLFGRWLLLRKGRKETCLLRFE